MGAVSPTTTRGIVRGTELCEHDRRERARAGLVIRVGCDRTVRLIAEDSRRAWRRLRRGTRGQELDANGSSRGSPVGDAGEGIFSSLRQGIVARHGTVRARPDAARASGDRN